MKEPGLQSRNADALSQVLFFNMSSLECRCLEESMWIGGQVHINTVEELGNMAAFHCPPEKKHCDLCSILPPHGDIGDVELFCFVLFYMLRAGKRGDSSHGD